MKNLNNNEILVFAEQEFKSFGLSESRKKVLMSVIGRLVNYMKEKGINPYSQCVGELFLKSIPFSSINRENNYRRAIDLFEYALNGEGYVHKKRKVYLYPGNLGQYVKDFLHHSECERRVSAATLRSYRFGLSNLCAFSELHGITVKNISESDVIKFISSKQNQSTSLISTIRLFFKYLNNVGIISSNFSECFQGFKQPHVNLPSVYNSGEIKQIEESASRASAINKRDYAMMLLASRLGLRASDICNMDFSNLDWQNKKIILIQQKTKKTIELPLLNDVGMAIIDYLQNGRGKSNISKVFLSMTNPLRQLRPNAVSRSISLIIKNSGVNIQERHHSSHSLRHSLATRVLENETGISVISEILGHQSSESTKVYLGVDVNLLLECSLDIPTIDNSFYKQEGGWFYE